MQVVAAVIVKNGQIFACRRAPQKSLPGKWEFPGGKLEAGESDHEALSRELLEELGVIIKPGELVATSFGSNPSNQIEMRSYFCTLAGEAPSSSTDHDELRWISKTELDKLDWAELDLPVVEALKALL